MKEAQLCSTVDKQLRYVEGRYFVIRSCMNNLVLTVSGDRPGSDVKTGACVNAVPSWLQLFYEDFTSGTIRCAANDLCLDVDVTTKIVFRPYINQASSQQWSIQGRSLLNRVSGYVVDISQGNYSAGVDVVSFPHHGGINQHWTFEYSNPKFFSLWDSQSQTGLCHSESDSDDLDVVVESGNWELAWFEDRFGIIRSKLDGMALDASGGKVKLKPYAAENILQQWIIRDKKLVNRYHLEKSLVPESKNLVVTEGNSFVWERIFSDDKPRRKPQGEYFFIQSQLNGLVLDIKGESKAEGASVVVWYKKATSCDNQLWSEDERTGTIRSKLNTFYCLTVNSNNSLIMKPYNKDDASQRWEAVDNWLWNRDDHDRVIDILGNAPEPGSQVGARKSTGATTQRWNFDYV